jgi:acyl-CoA thioesterase II
VTSPNPATFLELMTLQRSSADVFVGHTPDYPWGRVFGGQVVAQALMAAAETVETDQQVHSLHAYFVLGGTVRESITYEVDRLRDGKSFSTRRVVAQQAAGAILNLDASFHRAEVDADVQEQGLPDDVPLPADIDPQDWGGFGSNREFRHPLGVRRSTVWLKIDEDLGDDPLLHAAAISYLSDHNPLDAVVSSHPQSLSWEQMMVASLDHNLWFHRFVRADDWMLFDMHGHGLSNARGLATGLVHGINGVHATTVAQEGLARSPRP